MNKEQRAYIKAFKKQISYRNKATLLWNTFTQKEKDEVAAVCNKLSNTIPKN